MSLVKAMVKFGTITYNKFGDIPSIKGVANMMFAELLVLAFLSRRALK